MLAAGAILASLLFAQSWSAASADPGKTMVHVKGQSGKFTIYKENEGRSSGIEINMDALYELDIDENALQQGGQNKHSFNSFATQDFTIEPIENVTLAAGQLDDVEDSDDEGPLLSVAAEKVGFYADMPNVGQVRIDTYIIQQDGLLGPPNETWAVKTGDLKWNIVLSGWNWCGCFQGNGNNAVEKVGEMIDVVVSVKGLGAASQGGSGKNINLGGGVSLELSDQVSLDGVWTQMPAGYPEVTMSGNTVSLTFRFPRFTDRAVYDPAIRYGGDETTTTPDDGTTTTNDGTTTTNPDTDDDATSNATSTTAVIVTDASTTVTATETSTATSTTTPSTKAVALSVGVQTAEQACALQNDANATTGIKNQLAQAGGTTPDDVELTNVEAQGTTCSARRLEDRRLSGYSVLIEAVLTNVDETRLAEALGDTGAFAQDLAQALIDAGVQGISLSDLTVTVLEITTTSVTETSTETTSTIAETTTTAVDGDGTTATTTETTVTSTATDAGDEEPTSATGSFVPAWLLPACLMTLGANAA